MARGKAYTNTYPSKVDPLKNLKACEQGQIPKNLTPYKLARSEKNMMP